MLKWICFAWLLVAVMVPGARARSSRRQDSTGSVRGIVLDQDFGAPLPAAEVLIVETGQKAETSDQGNFVISDVPPGTYTLIFSKEGYLRSVKQEVQVAAGRLKEVDAQLAGDLTEMEEFVVEDVIGLGGGTEVGLLNLRFENAAFLDSVSSELMSRAGASDAASALRLVSGATIQDGKFAVIRGLPDRYVSSQLNGLRLPSADENTRAVELDQFPSSVIESIQVSKTFTPDQQGDASGGAVDVRLRGIPEERIFQFKIGTSYNTNVAGRNNFLSYEGGGLDPFGSDSGRRIQTENLGGNWDGAVGVSERGAPVDWKGSLAFGDRVELDNGWTFGGLGSFFYERDSSYYDDGRIDDLIVEQPGQGLVPVT
ncbi:MAG: carboxypeptidase regulatory-like domain-containing protein, partial [Planctomycetota bacterium]